MSQNRPSPLKILLGAFIFTLLLWRGPGAPVLAAAPAPALAEDEADDPQPPPAKTAKKKKKNAEPPPAEPTEEPTPAAEGSDAEKKTAAKKGADNPAKPDGEGETTGATAKLKKKPSVDEKYVLDNLQTQLSPTKLEVLPDGRVKMLFEFGPHKPEHETIFTPKVAKEPNSTFRWTLRYEYSGYSGSATRGADGVYYYGGLRLGQQGMAQLNAWFTDDVEAEILFAQGSNSSPQQTIALVLTGQSKKSIGSNWGTQCANYQNGRPKGGKGAIETVNMDTPIRIKLVVRNGIFEAHRDGRQKQTLEYNPKDFASSQLGFIWGGRLAGFIYKLEITGRLDAKKMAEVMKKTRK
jgi:hypothetical protein